MQHVVVVVSGGGELGCTMHEQGRRVRVVSFVL
jgi:hypothetical protein